MTSQEEEVRMMYNDPSISEYEQTLQSSLNLSLKDHLEKLEVNHPIEFLRILD